MGQLRFIAIVGALAGAWFLLFPSKQEWESTSHTFSPPNNASLERSRMVTQQVRIQTAHPESARKNGSLLNLISELDKLDSTDQQGLDSLYDKIETEFLRDERQVLSYFRERLNRIDNVSLDEMFFLIDSFARYAKAPEAAFESLMATQTPSDPESLGHAQMGPQGRVGMMKTFALEKVTELLRSDDEFRFQSLLPFIIRSAKNDPNLAVVREAFRVLSALPDKTLSRQMMWEVHQAREPNEFFSYSDLVPFEQTS